MMFLRVRALGLLILGPWADLECEEPTIQEQIIDLFFHVTCQMKIFRSEDVERLDFKGHLWTDYDDYHGVSKTLGNGQLEM